MILEDVEPGRHGGKGPQDEVRIVSVSAAHTGPLNHVRILLAPPKDEQDTRNSLALYLTPDEVGHLVFQFWHQAPKVVIEGLQRRGVFQDVPRTLTGRPVRTHEENCKTLEQKGLEQARAVFGRVRTFPPPITIHSSIDDLERVVAALSTSPATPVEVGVDSVPPSQGSVSFRTPGCNCMHGSDERCENCPEEGASDVDA